MAASMIHVIEDDASVRELIRCTLDVGGYDVECFETGEEFLDGYAGRKTPEVILLDIMLPGMDGFAVFKRLQMMPGGKEIPVIFLTARTSEADKVAGLNLGVDDYITKPFGVLELIARVNAAIRRKNKVYHVQDQLEYERLMMDLPSRKVYIDQKETALTFKEFELLRYLMVNQGIVLSREKLLDEIWGYECDVQTRTVDMHIKTLRQKLGEAAAYIQTVRGAGYRFGK